MLGAERPEEFHFTTKDTGAHECTLIFISFPLYTSLSSNILAFNLACDFCLVQLVFWVYCS